MKYIIHTHTNSEQDSTSDLIISIQIIGEKSKTSFIPLVHSVLNKKAFLKGKKDTFEVLALDVGEVCLNFNLLADLSYFLKYKTDSYLSIRKMIFI